MTMPVSPAHPQRGVDVTRARRLLAPWAVRQRYHRARLEGAERIPRSGPAILVSNHGRLDFDALILIRMLLAATGRLPRAMADGLWFRARATAAIARSIGAVEGSRANARALLEADELILTYPGGVREILQSRFGREDIDWSDRTGFAQLAIETGAPVIPIASIGVNNGFFFISSGRWLGHLLYQRILRLGDRYRDYRDPLAIGLIPVPLPYSVAVHFPLPCRIRYRVGAPVKPDTHLSAVEPFAGQVEDALRALVASPQ
ncbi:MAG: acyltransferase family protein [Candidatus Dadabacteria bacterium]|nr:MAG: acyltransferase family protein [Candidatus Dadabacteria bacterium]